MAFNKTALEILEKLGGKNNLKEVEFCMTRIRVSLIEGGKLDLISLKKINGVYGVLGKSTELQIVVGPGDAQEMAEALITIINQK